jgi:glycosyltransferase involved in cell wall biosynthesis
VSKNVALTMAEGAWITGHDADDLALPDRLERQVAFATEDGARSPASLSYMVRLSPGGMFSHLGRVSDFSPDGVARLASISCLFRTDFLRDRLGFWDSVRFGADTEMIARAERLAGKTFRTVPILSMLCLDVATSLTNHPELGVDRSTGMSPVRRAYRDSWVAWHDAHDDAEMRLPFPQDARRYRAPDQMIVSPSNLRETLSAMP